MDHQSLQLTNREKEEDQQIQKREQQECGFLESYSLIGNEKDIRRVYVLRSSRSVKGMITFSDLFKRDNV